MRPCTPTRMTIWPLTTAQSRAARTKMPWYFSDIASLLPSGGGGGNVNVEAPWRISRKGHSTFGCALVTGCGSFCVAPEKKLAILSLKEGAAGAGGGVAAVDAEAGGTEAVDAVVVAGAPTPPPLHPASNSKANAAPAGD